MPFSLAVSMSEARVAQFSAPSSCPAKRAFLRVRACAGGHDGDQRGHCRDDRGIQQTRCGRGKQDVHEVSTPARPVDVAADRILRAIERRPAAAFAAFLLVHVLLWTILPAIEQKNLQLDAIEGIA